jgi:Na+-transporting methylmalonyl-CoA/oxaloacetate decarboxylase gamma subunit
MSISESLLVALFCMAVVFAVLAILCLIIRVFSSIVSGFSKKERNLSSSTTTTSESSVEKTADQNNGESFSSGTLKLQNVDEPTAAMIMAIVSDESGIPLAELCFKSIKLITK